MEQSESRIKDQGSRIKDQGSRIKDQKKKRFGMTSVKRKKTQSGIFSLLFFACIL